MDFDSLVDDSQKSGGTPSAVTPASVSAPLRFDDLQDDEDKFGGLKGEALAGLAGVARGATLGLSDLALTKSGAVNPETLKGLSSTNPISSTVGNIAGGAGLVGLTGGLAAPIEGAALGAGALGATGAAALGMGAEGAVFGAGNALSDYAMGDPEMSAQKVLADIGIGGIFGAALGATGAKIKSYIGGSIEDAAAQATSKAETKAAMAGEDIARDSAARGSGGTPSPEDSGKLFKGLNPQKENAAEIIAAGQKYGIPVTPAMTSDSPWMQKAADALINGAPTFAGVAEQQTYSDIHKGAVGLINQALETGEDFGGGAMTKATLGEALQKSLTAKIEQSAEPTQAIYEALKPHMEVIPVAEKASNDVAEAISNLREVRVDPRSPAARLATRIAGSLENLDSVDDLKFLKSSIGQSLQGTASPGERHMAGVLADMLGDLEDKSIMKAATDSGLPAEAQATMRGLIDQRAEADAGYKQLIKKVQPLMEQLGKNKWTGPQSAIAHINNLDIEDVVQKLTNGKSEFAASFAKEFPEESALLRMYQKQVLAEKATIGGEFSPRKFLTSIERKNMAPEMLKHIFTPDELEKINAGDTLLKALPKNFNPSGTSGMNAFRAFMESPAGAAIGNARDYGIKAFMHAMDALPQKPNPYQVGSELAQQFNHFQAVNKIAGEVDEKIASGVSSIFDRSAAVKGGLTKTASLLGDFGYDKAREAVSNIANHPSGGIDHMVAQTENLQGTMPNFVQGVHNAATQATLFLQSKIPQAPNRGPLDKPYDPSNAEKAKFMRYFNAVNDPISTLKDVRSGMLTQESMDALKTVHPKLLAAMQKQIMNEYASRPGKDLPYSVRLSLSKFMGHPLDASLQGPSIQANQASISAPQLSKQNAAPTGRRGSFKNFNPASRVETMTAKHEIGEE